MALSNLQQPYWNGQYGQGAVLQSAGAISFLISFFRVKLFLWVVFFFLRTTKIFPVILPFRSNSPPPTPLLSVTEKNPQTNVEVKMIERDHRKSKRKWERKEKKIRGGASLSESQPTCILNFYCCSVSQNKARGIQPFCCPSVFCPVVVLTVDSEAKQRTEGHSCFVSILLESKKGNKEKDI